MGRRFMSARGLAVLLGCTVLSVAGCSSDAGADEAVTQAPSAMATPLGDGNLVVGTLFPAATDPVGAAAETGVKLAVSQINAAGGVNGKQVTVVGADVAAPDAATQLSDGKADVVIGTPVSVEQAAGLAAVKATQLWISPPGDGISATGAVFRLDASQALLAGAVPEVVKTDGKSKPGLLTPAGVDSKAIMDAFSAGAQTADVTPATDPVTYDPAATNFAVEVTKVKSADPDAIVLAGGAPLKNVVGELAAQRVGPSDVALYVVGQNAVDQAALPAGTLTGAKAVRLGAEVNDARRAELTTINPQVSDVDIALRAYDATVMAALAAAAAKDDAGESIATVMPDLGRGEDACDSPAACLPLASGGKVFAYTGGTGQVAFDKEGARIAASVAVAPYGDDNRLQPATYITVGATG